MAEDLQAASSGSEDGHPMDINHDREIQRSDSRGSSDSGSSRPQRLADLDSTRGYSMDQGGPGSPGSQPHRPWSYRRYSHQVFSRTPSMDETALSEAMVRRKSRSGPPPPSSSSSSSSSTGGRNKTPDVDIQKQIASFVKETIQERQNSVDLEPSDDPDLDVEDDLSEDESPTDEQAYPLAESLDFQLEHISLDHLAIEAVDPDEFEAVLGEDAENPKCDNFFTSQRSVTLGPGVSENGCDDELMTSENNNEKDTNSRVNCIVLSAVDVEEYREILSTKCHDGDLDPDEDVRPYDVNGVDSSCGNDNNDNNDNTLVDLM